MKIDGYINSLDFAQNLIHVHTLLKQAQAGVSFWGTRVISVKGYDGSFSLDEVAKKVFLTSKQRCISDDLTIAERVKGPEIVDKLRKFYLATDTEISQANCFTKLLIWLREFTFSSHTPHTPRFHIEKDETVNYFRAYSRERFDQVFKNVLESQSSRNERLICLENIAKGKIQPVPMEWLRGNGLSFEEIVDGEINTVDGEILDTPRLLVKSIRITERSFSSL